MKNLRPAFMNVLSLTRFEGSLNRDADQNQKAMPFGGVDHPYASEFCEAHRTLLRGTAECPTKDNFADFGEIVDPRTGKPLSEDRLIQSREGFRTLANLWEDPEKANRYIRVVMTVFSGGNSGKAIKDWEESSAALEKNQEILARIQAGEEVFPEVKEGKSDKKAKSPRPLTEVQVLKQIETLESKLGKRTAQVLEVYPSQLSYFSGLVQEYQKQHTGSKDTPQAFEAFLVKEIRTSGVKLTLPLHAILRGQFTMGPLGRIIRAVMLGRPVGILPHTPVSDILTVKESYAEEIGHQGAGTMQDRDISYNIYLRYAYFDLNTAAETYTTNTPNGLRSWDQLDEAGINVMSQIAQKLFVAQHYLVGNSRRFDASFIIAAEFTRSGMVAPSITQFDLDSTVQTAAIRFADVIRQRYETYHHTQRPVQYVVHGSSEYAPLFEGMPYVTYVTNLYQAAEACGSLIQEGYSSSDTAIPNKTLRPRPAKVATA